MQPDAVHFPSSPPAGSFPPPKDEPNKTVNERFLKDYRLLKRWEFERVYREGKKFVRKDVILYVLKLEGTEKKAGIAVGKAVGPAVVRNLIRRRIREALRRSISRWQEGRLVVVVARSSAKERNYHELKEAIEELLKKTGVLREG